MIIRFILFKLDTEQGHKRRNRSPSQVKKKNENRCFMMSSLIKAINSNQDSDMVAHLSTRNVFLNPIFNLPILNSFDSRPKLYHNSSPHYLLFNPPSVSSAFL